MNNQNVTETIDLAEGLSKIRSRRWLMWFVIIAYIPGLIIALEMQATTTIMSWLFAFWVLLLCIVVGLATVSKCPRCNNSFHTNGPTFLPVRNCVHCGLHLKSDKTLARDETMK